MNAYIEYILLEPQICNHYWVCLY